MRFQGTGRLPRHLPPVCCTDCRIVKDGHNIPERLRIARDRILRQINYDLRIPGKLGARLPGSSVVEIVAVNLEHREPGVDCTPCSLVR